MTIFYSAFLQLHDFKVFMLLIASSNKTMSLACDKELPFFTYKVTTTKDYATINPVIQNLETKKHGNSF